MTLVQSFSGICQGPVRLGGNYFVSQVIFGTSQALKLISYTPTKLDSVTFQGDLDFFVTKPRVFLFCLFVCFCCFFFKHPIYFYRSVSPPGVKVNFCHAHKVRFCYPLGMIIMIMIIIYYLFLFFLFLLFFDKHPCYLKLFCKAVLLFLKRSISSSFWYLLQSLK